jgi:release factor glutamine methyltransferase
MNDIFSDIINDLASAGIKSPRLEARIIIAEVLKCSTGEIGTATKVSAEQRQQITCLVNKRKQHAPLDKILGHKEFYKWDFTVNEDVLSPRPDTEILLENALKYAPKDKKIKILDLGTGSGCLLISLLKELPLAYGVAADVSESALNVAQKNAANLNVSERIKFIHADWFSPDFCSLIGNTFDIIVTNPPYIPTNDITDLDDEVRLFDPLLALDGGTDGYASYRKIASLIPLLLKSKGYIFIEAGMGQALHINDIFAGFNLQPIDIVPDLAGIDRCIILQKSVA